VVVGCSRISDNGVCPCGSAVGRGFVFFSRGMAACRGNMLVFRRVDLVSCVVMGRGELAGFCEGWRNAVESPIAGSVPGEYCRVGFLVVVEAC
jgi:hypothetical protein